jgi:hypothetical protein
LRHSASARFWAAYEALPADVRAGADKSYALLKADPRHPSLHFKRVGSLWSVRIGERYRALAHEVEEGYHWFWTALTLITTSSSDKAG